MGGQANLDGYFTRGNLISLPVKKGEKTQQDEQLVQLSLSI
jgi:hypothetical protein